MLRFSAALSASLTSRNGILKAALNAPRATTSSASLSSAVPSSLTDYTLLFNASTLKQVYISTVALLNGAKRPLLSRAAVRPVVSRLSGQGVAKARPLASTYVPRRVYCETKDMEKQILRSKRAEEEIARISRRSPGLWGWFRGTIKLGTLLLNAGSIWYLHTALNKDNPTWVSYLALVPLLNWIPLLDLAQLDRAWALLPLGTVIAAGFFHRVWRGPLALLAVLPAMGAELYKNYHLLHHFEAFNWTTVIGMSLLRIEWLVHSCMAILGPEYYRLEPAQQRSVTEVVRQVELKLDRSLEDPAMLNDFNPAFIAMHYIWKHVPVTRELSGHVSNAYTLSGMESVVETVSDKVSSLLDTNTHTPSGTSGESKDKQKSS
jgi:hypothetical protein